MKDKLKKSEKREDKPDRNNSTSSKRRMPDRDPKQYEEVKITNTGSQNDSRENENQGQLNLMSGARRKERISGKLKR